MTNHIVTDIATLEKIYGKPAGASVFKEVNYIHPVYRPFIESSPFVALATVGSAGMDISPRGDQAGFVLIENEKTLLLPDRIGNNRIDSLRNIVHDNRIALLFFIPGIGETLRINGRAEIVIDPEILERCAYRNKRPRSVLRITVDAVFFQCSRAILRSGLWDSSTQLERSVLPSAGKILQEISKNALDGADYDARLPQLLKNNMY
ncbi:pyridoxamine 5'-phosphate oxidase family protein [Xenorhabdus nematophila]|uniref:Pyridoxamine 5'-phosphate oxidase family protein n=1 Tax=Xenorhabdus nematophila (strain ATCC 19061 / DSM 3370 / CCUG 14189 / LMG 1036 / NCIMB 9965 / AN6) TaxID=406817 RepID=D3VFJ8_XENNA|nr:pyridoxamine 5'-phosphate oxidase family protein [Xenorhabdus nematophila]CEF30310.1 Putative pyridoxamine 5'-phosphate oxidase [Xenorhabdus nematophila str. Websteri]AYA40227.1 pyridoxamine 5'-phosphate oxidase family protein [Xenorhabdus nematophila]MBA0018896.1 pyridoxamine 5'-phosphate oxidase family protein [Xenorhabdus nematophila]MCB4424955.1 pyridoxamine 5'-phosphate oxidase family protein [Xenorhabdus nematophila]QNJ37865.1 pyridoxamine 5'-phosphate oxidase family protein [Xenorhab